MTQPLSDLTQQMITLARAAGADSADAVAIEGTSVAIDVRAGVLEKADRAEGIDIGLRVFVGKQQAIVSSSDTKPDTLHMMAERAVAMANDAPEDPYAGLADPDQLTLQTDCTALDLFDPGPEPNPAALQDAAVTAEVAALDTSVISQVQSASAGYSRRNIHVSASNGFSGGYSRSSHSVSCVAIAGKGAEMERDYDYDSRIYHADLRDTAEIGRVAAQRAAERQGARKPKTGQFPVLFDERIASGLIGHLVSAINGAAITRGASWLRDAMGQQVLPAGLSLIEDPHRPRAFASRIFDTEGLPTQKRAIVEDGMLTGWTLDLRSARQLGLQSTASAGRSPSSPPSPGVSNLALTQGDVSRADLIADMGTGLLVTSMIGATINPNTGDYSRGASGFWVENGALAYPVNECTVAGNLRDMLMRIIPANDARAHLSHVVPSLLVEGLTLAGE
jgi:PmbA protein